MLFFGKKAGFSLTVLPSAEACPAGEIVQIRPGQSIVEALLANDIEISHSCQMQCACTTCHILVLEGSRHVSPMHAEEADMLKRTEGCTRWSRLGCQTVLKGDGNVTIEIAD